MALTSDNAAPRRRMTGPQRRAQLIDVSRGIFARKGPNAVSMEEIALAAGVSKPVVYEHFGSKENLYATVVAAEMELLERTIRDALTRGRARYRIEQAVLALLTYVEDNPDGFSIISRDPGAAGGYATLLNNATDTVAPILTDALARSGFNPAFAALYGQCIVGMISQTAKWWLEQRQPDKETVAAHIVNLCWNGLAGMETDPTLQVSGLPASAPEGAKFGAGADADPTGRKTSRTHGQSEADDEPK